MVPFTRGLRTGSIGLLVLLTEAFQGNDANPLYFFLTGQHHDCKNEQFIESCRLVYITACNCYPLTIALLSREFFLILLLLGGVCLLCHVWKSEDSFQELVLCCRLAEQARSFLLLCRCRATIQVNPSHHRTAGIAGACCCVEPFLGLGLNSDYQVSEKSISTLGHLASPRPGNH